MATEGSDVTIVIAEDDDDDFLLTRKALEEAGFAGSLHRVADGEELMGYLEGAAEGRLLVLLLDLNMPRMDGREALRRIKSSARLRRIPVVVLTTSAAESDVLMAYDSGANSYIRKPAGYAAFRDSIKMLKRYWLEVVDLPQGEAAGPAAPSGLREGRAPL